MPCVDAANEKDLEGRTLSVSAVRETAAVALLGIATVISSFGLIGLIAQGYGTLTLGFIVVYVIPVLTVGVWKIRSGTA